MSHTNSTTNYALPQFLTSDKPAWLTDVNNAFSDIDTAVYAAQTKADTAYSDAGNAQSDATTAINNAAAADAKGSGALASIEASFDPTAIYSIGSKVMYNSLLYRCIVAVVTPGPWTGSDNWERINVDTLISTVDSKIGNLSSLSTSDKTSIVNAMNEVNGSKINPPDLANITKQSLTSGTAIQVTSTGKWYCVFAENRDSAITCFAYILDSNNSGYLAAGTAGNATYVRCTSGWVYIPAGATFYARAQFTNVGELMSCSPL